MFVIFDLHLEIDYCLGKLVQLGLERWVVFSDFVLIWFDVGQGQILVGG